MQCIFCKIINKKIPSEILYKDKKVIAVKDIQPSAPAHFLIIPKKHIKSINQINSKNKELMGDLILAAKKIAKKQKISEGYKLVFNVGRKGGQIIEHLHLHLLGGWRTTKEREDISKMP